MFVHAENLRINLDKLLYFYPARTTDNNGVTQYTVYFRFMGEASCTHTFLSEQSRDATLLELDAICENKANEEKQIEKKLIRRYLKQVELDGGNEETTL